MIRNTALGPAFAGAFRAELVAYVDRATRPFWRRRRFWIAGFAIVGTLAAGGGFAVASLSTLPGAPLVTTLGETVEAERAGTAEVDLGTVPEGATHVSLELTCRSAATFVFPDGASMTCAAADIGQTAFTRIRLTPGMHSIRIEAPADARWGVRVAYVNETTTPWAINAKGETYGVANEAGTPNLIAVVTTEGREGYAYAAELAAADGTAAAEGFTSPEEALEWQESMSGRRVVVPVYLSDGTTRIGDFVIEYP
jgi:hypothetical protein